MRAGLSTIQQTLTQEAATVLNHSIAEATKRNHSQTTPLHVAATLLASPTSFLRQACIKSHPNSSHPLQCRALELCFSVALERLPTCSQNVSIEKGGYEPPVSNALMAALKRAQAHQRRGCPEQQQQPLLAVKVELEQLIISILDDPSVSRVMREASFSSPAVKATIEKSLSCGSGSQSNSQNHQNLRVPGFLDSGLGAFGVGSIGTRMLASPVGQLGQGTSLAGQLSNRNMYTNPRLQNGSGGGLERSEEVVASNGPQLGQGNAFSGQLSSRNMYTNPRLQNGSGGSQRDEVLASPVDQLIQGKSLSGQLSNRNMYTNPRLQNESGGDEEVFASPVNQLGQGNVFSGQLSNRNMYLNPRLQNGSGGGSEGQRDEEVKKLIDVLMREKKRNPVLVGEGEPEAIVKELFRRIEKGELNGEGCLKNVQLIQFDKEFVSDKNQISSKIIELGGLIESKLARGSVLVDLGDLRWLVEHPVGQPPQQQVVSETGKAAVVEMGKLLAKFNGNCNNNNGINDKIWFIGIATCETYLRCQVYHPTMENDWDLQAVPIASRSPPLPGMFPSPRNNRLLGNPGEPLSALKSSSSAKPTLSSNLSDNLNVARKLKLCPSCSEKYEVELKNLEKDTENSNSDFSSESPHSKLPQWLQNAKLQDNHAKSSVLQGKNKDKPEELQKKWNETCLGLHPSFHHNVSPDRTAMPALAMPTLRNPVLAVHQPFQPKLQLTRNLGEIPKLNENPLTFRPPLNKNLIALRPSLNENPPTLRPSLNDNPAAVRPYLNKNAVTLRPSLSENTVTYQPPENARGSPGSPVRTDLVLGRKTTESSPEKVNEVNFKDFLGSKPLDKFSNELDAGTFKKLIKGLMEKAWWQADAASGVAQAVTRCRLGNGKQRGGGSRGDIWLLFTGPDRVGKRKMASVLSEQICGTSPVMICVGLRRDHEEKDVNYRGKTGLDRIAEAVRRDPFSVIMIEDIDEADLLIRGNIKGAIDRGRLTDTHGREISLGNVVFIVTGNWSTVSSDDQGNWMNKRQLIKNGNWNLRLTVSEKGIKRSANWLLDQDRPPKIRRELNSGYSFDLNLAADTEDNRADGSHNSSDLTSDNEEELGIADQQFAITAVPNDLLNAVDDAIVFRPVDFHFIRKEIRKTIANKFSIAVDDKISMQVEDAALEKLIGGLLHGKTSLEQWVENALGPSFEQLESLLQSAHENVGVRLELDPDVHSESYGNGDELPSKLRILADGIQK
ncbi:chaperone [Lithospermum erythrorhizon]|uniref:Chaperone n=1 Tax=Lithospermum erythrorhizon TaxID=34254 RepID=A0AAV3Q7Q9_LITER